MTIFKKLFRPKEHEEPQSLRVNGIDDAPITPVPDDAELAATALLGKMADTSDSPRVKKKKQSAKGPSPKGKDERGLAYYRGLAERVRAGREMETRITMRYLAYCEQELRNTLLNSGQLTGLERGLYDRIDIVNREGGELKRRWQHCLAEVTVRLMDAVNNTD